MVINANSTYPNLKKNKKIIVYFIVLKSVFEALLSNSCKNAFEIKFIFQDMFGNLRFIDENILKKMHILEIFKIDYFLINRLN